MLDKDKLKEVAKEQGTEIDFGFYAGVYDSNDRTTVSFEELFFNFLEEHKVKYQVEWKHDQLGEHNIHGVYDTHEEAMDSIYEWWLKNEYEPRYVRYWTTNGVTKIDYGFHNMFYYIREIRSA